MRAVRLCHVPASPVQGVIDLRCKREIVVKLRRVHGGCSGAKKR